MSKKSKKEKYEELVEGAIEVCERKGWRPFIQDDDSGYQFATIKVSKRYDNREVTAVLEITIGSDDIAYKISKTSFYDTGLDTLLKAISVKFEEIGYSGIEKSQEKKARSLFVDWVARDFKVVVNMIYGLLTLAFVIGGLSLIIWGRSETQQFIGFIFAFILPVLDIFGVKSFIPSWKEALEMCESKAQEKVDNKLE